MRLTAPRLAFLSAGLLVAGSCTNQLPTFIEDTEILAVDILPDCTILNIGQTCTLEARALTDGGERVPDVTLQWESRQPNIATVEANRDRGVVTARNEGLATITASVPDSDVEDRVTVRVVRDPSEDPLAEVLSLEFQVTADQTAGALSGSFIVQSNAEGGVAVESFEIEGSFRPAGGAGFTGVDVTGCTRPQPLPFRVDFRQTFEFLDCDLSQAVASGATVRITVLVETDVLQRALEIVEESTVP